MAHRQLVALGLSPSGVGRRADRGGLRRIHHGVYAVGHPRLTERGLWMAAVLGGAPGTSVLSHRTAGALWDFLPAAAGPVDVTAPSRRRTRAGIRPHRATLQDDERTVHDGIPVTEPMRTLIDLASVLGTHRLQRAVDLARAGRGHRRRRLELLLERHHGGRGLAACAWCWRPAISIPPCLAA